MTGLPGGALGPERPAAPGAAGAAGPPGPGPGGRAVPPPDPPAADVAAPEVAAPEVTAPEPPAAEVAAPEVAAPEPPAPGVAAPEVAAGPVPHRTPRPGRPRRSRGHVVRLVGLALLAAALVGTVGFVRDDGAFVGAGPARADGPGDEPVPETAAGQASSSLLVATGADGRADLVVLAAIDRSGTHGEVLLVPPTTQVETPSFGLQTLADLPPLGGEGAAAMIETSVENVLGVAVTDTVVTGDIGAVWMLEPAGSIDVRLRSPVRIETPQAAYAWPAGQQRLGTADAARILALPHVSSDMERLVAVQAVLEGWLAALRQPAVAAVTLARMPGLASLVALAGTDPRFDVLPVRSVTDTGGEQRYLLDREALPALVRRSFADLAIGTPGGRPRVEILNGTGTIGLAQRVAERVVPAGGEVTLSGNVPGFGRAQTQVVYYRDEDRAVAERLRDALGVGTVEKARTTLGVVDVTIVAGADL